MHNLYLSILFLLSTLAGLAQIEHGGSPRSWSLSLQNNIAGITTQGVNLAALAAEDALNDSHKDIPWRFGEALPLNLDLGKAGSWTTLDNGDRICRIQIASSGAQTLNLNYSKFDLPAGADLFIYSSNKAGVLGSFNRRNNISGGPFATTLLYGSKIILEYFEPLSVQGQGKIIISSVVHGYRGFKEKAKNFGASGGCNVDLICDSLRWWDETRAEVLILKSNNTRLCSGVLLNNVRQDGTPYVLSATHCGVSPTDVFMFNYRSPSCTNLSDGPTNMTVVGNKTRALESPFDFQLVELDTIPPASYNVFYAGWSIDSIPTECATGIHHPRGDVAKISHDLDSVTHSGYYSAGNDHWQVKDWDSGTTEPVSSGSPLFDAHHRVIGQLHGGNAACGNDLQDYYGKTQTAWNTIADSSRQLRYWLDPDTSLIGTYISGYDPAGPKDILDAMLLKISGIPRYQCTDTLEVGAIIRNHGSDTLKSLDIVYNVNGGSNISTSWTGLLPPYDTERVPLNTTPISTGNHTIKVWLSNPNSGTDLCLINDTLSQSFTTNDTNVAAVLTFKTDNFGSESKWKIVDGAGTILYDGGPYPDVVGGVTYTQNLCLWDDCFLLVVTDQFNDGTCCSFGNGFHLITNGNGDTLGFNNNFTSARDSIAFCPADSCNVYLFATHVDATNGTSSDGSINLNVTGPKSPFTYMWQPGGQTTQDLTGLAPGLYSVTVTDSSGCSDTLAVTVGVKTSVNELSLLENVAVFPNPADGYVFLRNGDQSIDKGNITIYDLSGKVLFSETVKLSAGEQRKISLLSIAKQLVIVQIEVNRETRYFKIAIR